MGHHNIHFSGDPYSSSGAWSPPTSTANFCEEDYVITRYLAEFVNSLTNIIYVYFALQYMYGPGSRGILRPNLDFMSIALLVLGIGSFLFHASMRQTLMLVDDLSMLLVMWSLLQATVTIRQSPTKARLISTALAFFFLLFSAFYIQSGKIIY